MGFSNLHVIVILYDITESVRTFKFSMKKFFNSLANIFPQTSVANDFCNLIITEELLKFKLQIYGYVV